MKSLIIGEGEVGRSLGRVLRESYETKIIDADKDAEGKFAIMHICFPYSENFTEEVKRYRKKYDPNHTVIHSTVPVGTSRACGAIHSPVRGRHPDLSEGIRAFVKFVGGEDADEVAEYFLRAGLKVQLCRKPETTELAKIISTSYYALCIEFVKEAERLCAREDVPFGEAFTLFQKTYNEGYEEVGNPEFQRPNLQPLQKEQGGHCTIPNLDFLESDFADFIREQNKKGKVQD